MRRFVIALSLVAIVLAACGGDEGGGAPQAGEDVDKEAPGPSGSDKQAEPAAAPTKPEKVDPRKNGFEVALGEWSVTPEAPAIRPGKVTFVIRNRGTMPHGFEIELEGESSGSGSGDLFKAESRLLQPGETTRMTVSLQPGVHKIECLVEGHDDMGMEGPLDMRAGAPLVKEKTEQAEGLVSIANFEFDPAVTKVSGGTAVAWRNDDSAPHTVSATDGSFDSDTLDPGKDFSFVFDEPGTYDYRCNIHPEMKGTVEVRN